MGSLGLSHKAEELRTRLAPTPSGYLHLGNALSFVVTWALARAARGWILLRIDDLDAARRRPEYVEDVFRTLEWLGLDYDEGPTGPDHLLKAYSQKLRLPLYREALAELRRTEQLYACTCSRREIRKKSKDGRYPGTCIPLGKNFDAPKTAWRVQVPEDTSVPCNEWQKGMKQLPLDSTMGDFVVWQKNRAPAYQITSLVDDRHWEINFIVRGADLLESTTAQLYLAQLLDYQSFTQTTFWHHELITGPNGEKLSKSKGADAIKNWREAGKAPAEIFKMAADWLGIPPKDIGKAEDLVQGLE